MIIAILHVNHAQIPNMRRLFQIWGIVDDYLDFGDMRPFPRFQKHELIISYFWEKSMIFMAQSWRFCKNLP